MAPQTTLAVVSQTGESLSFFHLATGSLTDHLPNLIPEPHELCYDPQRHVLYLTHAYQHGWYGGHGPDGHQLSVIDCSTRRVVDVIDISPAKGPHHALLDAAHDTLHVCVEGGLDGATPRAGGILALDLSTRKVISSVASGSKSHWFATATLPHTNLRKAYTCNKDGGFISVLDLQTSTLLTTLPTPTGTEQPSTSPDGAWVYFPTPTLTEAARADAHEILVLDTAADDIARRIPMETLMLATHVTRTGSLLVGQHTATDGQLVVLAGHDEGYRRLGTVTVGRGPLTITSDAEGATAFVAGTAPGTVTVVDLRAMRAVRTMVVDGVKRADKAFHVGAHGMAVF